MSYRVTFLPEIEQDFEKIDPQIAQRIINKIKWLSENFQIILPQPLKGDLKGLYKLRVGDYRVIYSVNENAKRITIHLVGHRKDIYK